MAGMRAAIAVCLVIFALDVSAGVLAMKAQSAADKGKRFTVLFIERKEPVYQAYKLGLAAAGFLVAAHTIATYLDCCDCIFSRQKSILASLRRKLAFLSWTAFGVAFSSLLVGAMTNAQSEASWNFIIYFDLLGLGSKICFVHGVITIAYSVTAMMAASKTV